MKILMIFLNTERCFPFDRHISNIRLFTRNVIHLMIHLQSLKYKLNYQLLNYIIANMNEIYYRVEFMVNIS